MYKVTQAVSVQLNVNDLHTLHKGITSYCSFALSGGVHNGARIDPQVFDLARRIERALLETCDMPAEEVGRRMTEREKYETTNYQFIDLQDRAIAGDIEAQKHFPGHDFTKRGQKRKGAKHESRN